MNNSHVYNTAPTSFSESESGMCVSNDPILGGIIDKRIVDGKWFVIFNDDDLEMIEEINSREDAFQAYQHAIDAKYWV